MAAARLCAQDIFCTNYERGECKQILDLSDANTCEAFKQDPLDTMIKHNASIVCYGIPVGALGEDRRLKLNNPISLTGKLPSNMQAHAGDQNAADVTIGNYASPQGAPRNGATLSEEMFRHLFGNNELNHAVDYANCNTYENSSRLINTLCFHTMQVRSPGGASSVDQPRAEIQEQPEQPLGGHQPQHRTLWRGEPAVPPSSR